MLIVLHKIMGWWAKTHSYIPIAQVCKKMFM